MRANLLIRGASEVLTCAGPAPRRGAAQADAGRLRDASIAALDGRIVFVGSSAACERAVRLDPAAVVIEAAGGSIVPGFVDPHTHLLYAGDRAGELDARLRGATYAEISRAGGGILSTVRATRGATVDALVAAGAGRLRAMLRCGTTTCEVKSGYGLTTESELTLLRAARQLEAALPVAIAPTFMGAHELPPEYAGRRGDYVALVIEEMMPAVVGAGLAEWCDVFCEDGVFSVDESRRILLAARTAGLKLRIHADELGPSGGALLAAELRCRSADHLVFTTREAASAMAAADVAATLLPATSFYLRLGRYAPARMLIEAGVPVALATDVNPGGGLSPSMPFAMALACFGMGLTFEEALVAATLNAAWSLDRHESAGSLEPGKRMDAVIVDGAAADLLRVDAAVIRQVIVGGRAVTAAETGAA